MKVTKMPLEALHLPERNVRIHSHKQIAEFARSVEMFGQIRPIVVDENGEILAGCGLYETLQQMGRTEADVYRVTDLSSAQKKKLMIADNKVFSLGVDNLAVLNAFLEDLGDDLDIPGFDPEVLQAMTADAEEITEQISSYGVLGEEEINNIRSHGERMEARSEARQAETQQESQPVQEDRPAQAATPERAEEPTEVRQFVVCPHCGEKVWL